MSETDITEDSDVTEDRADTPEDQTPDGLDPATAEVLAKVRREAKNLRERAKAAEARADELARALFTARVAATGKVENAAEIPFDADVLDDDDALTAAIDAAITERPYIKARKVSGDIGQGVRGDQTGPKDFSGLLR
ncbi:hypothetical protein SBI67_17835 [Mycolicibacterium sp. 120266]|uniref:hypothetical protein n=1 Tax=Mycolicibacterium sp. 120266 TaxID=3090601 RepID=UPI00299EB494|nr:hypothetical protein [Mycolicibacterium sp. 120266]MDX1873986.1 hypothetical protein [Mycolicibacterium sp. 120266]